MWGSIENFIDCLVKYDLTAEQAFFLWLIYLGQQDPRLQKYMYKYCNEKNLIHGHPEGGFSRATVDDLINRGFIKELNNRGLHYDNIEINPDFRNEFFVRALLAGDELWDTYPQFIDDKFPARSFTKFYPTKDALYKDYCRIIKYSREEHNKNIECIKHAIAANKIKVGLVEWIQSEMWKDFEPIKTTNKVRYA